MAVKTLFASRSSVGERLLKSVCRAATDASQDQFKPSRPLRVSKLDRAGEEKPHKILDIAEFELNEFCSILPPSDEADDCWTAYNYLEKERIRGESSCSVELTSGGPGGVGCQQLEHFENTIRELVSEGKIRDLIAALSTLARLDAKAAAGAIAQDISPVPSTPLPPAADGQRRDCLVTLFYSMDTDCNGRLDTAEFREAMKSLGDELTGEVVATIFEAMDIHGYLDLDQFIAVVEAEEIRSHSSVAEMLRRLHFHPKWWTENPLDTLM